MLVLAGCSAGAAGCGGSDAAVAIARVGKASISKGSFDHWLHIVAVRDFELAPTQPVPSWVIPDPPAYKRCIAHLAGTTRPSGPDSYKAMCEERYENLKQQTLDFLITAAWLIQDGRAHGIRESDEEVRARVARVLTAEFGSRARFEHDRIFIGETFADEMLRSRFKVYSEKMETRFKTLPGKTPAQREQSLAVWANGLPSKWAPRTTCSPGYVVPNCREYEGPEQPHIQL